VSPARFKVSLEYPSPLELPTALSVSCTPESFEQVLWFGCDLMFCVTCFKQQLLERGLCGAASWLSPGDAGINWNTRITPERVSVELDFY